ncbi:MAG: hypothetical protein JOZ54_24650 [Acidobacteria bacterium]|nr:hypothetical protein [Acidobacteriota bacterium]
MEYIVKFDDQQTRRQWLQALEVIPEYQNIRYTPSPFLPDVILYNVREEQLPQLRDLAHDRARFIADFAHDLFRPA